jgi:hypothetical protein
MSFKVAFRHALLLASLLPAPTAVRTMVNYWTKVNAVNDNEESKMTPTTAIETERCSRLQWVKYIMSSVDDGLLSHVQDLFVATYADVQMNFSEWNKDAAALRGNFAGLEVLCCSPCGDGVPAISACLPLAGQVFDIRNEKANKYSALFTIDSPRLADNAVVAETRKCASSMSKEEVAAFLPFSDPDGSKIKKDESKDSTLGFSYKSKPLQSNTMLFDHMYNELAAPSGGAAQEASGKPAQVLKQKYALHPEAHFEVVKEMLGPGDWVIESPKEEGTTYTRSSWRGGEADVSENMFGAPLAAGLHWSDIDSPLRYPVKDE